MSLQLVDHLLRLKCPALWATLICPGAAGMREASSLPDLIFSVIHSFPSAVLRTHHMSYMEALKKKSRETVKRIAFCHIVQSI